MQTEAAQSLCLTFAIATATVRHGEPVISIFQNLFPSRLYAAFDSAIGRFFIT